MEIARGGRIEFALILTHVIRRVHQSFVARLLPKSAALAERTVRLVLGGNRGRGESKMADDADDLGIPRKPARPVPAATPPQTADLSDLTAGPTPAPTSSTIPVLARPGAQSVKAPGPPRPKTDQSVHQSDSSVEQRKLIVGRGIALSGKINSCDRLVIEGSVHANLQNCQQMIIAESGLFEGNAAIDDVEVFGRLEGDLVVQNRLLIRASGQVSGTITYGQIEIEAGGRISGVIQAHDGPKGFETIAASLLRPQ
jgi:cytoskeletal protein CcmA (bactofilin family)